MLILGIESSCDETGVALYDTDKGLIADALHTQIEMHRLYGGVVPELASRDHIRRIIPLLNEVMKKAADEHKALCSFLIPVIFFFKRLYSKSVCLGVGTIEKTVGSSKDLKFSSLNSRSISTPHFQ